MSYTLYGISIMIYLAGLLCTRAKKYTAANFLLSLSTATAFSAIAIHIGGTTP